MQLLGVVWCTQTAPLRPLWSHASLHAPSVMFKVAFVIAKIDFYIKPLLTLDKNGVERYGVHKMRK